MLNAIIRFSIRNKLIIGLFTLGWIIWGAIELIKLPVDALPDITSNQVQVITVSPTLGALEVERLITFPIEQASSNIQQVSERMLLVRDEIPKEAGTPELAPVTTGLGEIYQYIVRPKKGYEDKFDLTELRTIQDWIIRRQLLGTPGVADVSSFGGKLKQYEVAIDPVKLKGAGVTFDQVYNAIQNNNQNSGAAYIEKGPSLLFVRSEGLVKSVEEIQNIYVAKSATGTPIYIRDIAEARIGSPVRYGALTYMDEGEVSGAVVLMLKGENAADVIGHIEERMKQIQKSLPEGVEINTFLDRTKMVNRTLGTVKTNLLEGAMIVLLILVFFLGNFRAGLIVASVIPLAMLFAVGMMNLFGVTGNLMSLGALDFGLIVDGAVIIVEAVLHRLHSNRHMGLQLRQGQMDQTVEQSAGRMMGAAVFGQIIILIVYIPILSLTGIEGKMFKPMAQTVAFALVGAFILSLTYVPMMTSIVLSKKLDHKDNISDRMMLKLQHGFQKALARLLAHPKKVVLGSLALLALSFYVASTLGGEFIPELEEGDFAIDARLMTGSSLGETIDATTKAVHELKKFPEVQKVVTRIGASEIPTDPMPIEMTDIIVNLKPKNEWTSATSYDELANKMSTAIGKVPGLTGGFQYPVQMRFNELIAGAKQDVVCKIFGEDLDTLAFYAAQYEAVIHKVEGAKDVFAERVTGLPQIVIKYKPNAIAAYGLSIADVNRVLRASFAGESAGQVYENERRFDLVLRLKETRRNDLTDIKSLTITNADGIAVPLEQVADIGIQEGPNQVQREDAKRRITVAFNVRDRDVQSVVKEVQSRAEKTIALPAGYYVKYGGQFENLVEAKDRLMIAVPIALLLILLILYFSFGSLRYGLLIYTAIPLSAIGGILLLWMRDMPFSISAGVGFIALFGVAVLNGIVLINEFNRLKNETQLDMRDLVLKGTSTRLRPVLMTAAVASLGFLPMALSTSSGAEVQRPLATVVIGGLISATLLTLFVLPVLYVWVEKRKGSIKAPALSLMLGFLCLTASGQNIESAWGHVPNARPAASLPMDSIIALADRNAISLKIAQKQVEYYAGLKKKSAEISKTVFGAEYGNINSAFNDTRFYLNQQFQLPKVYARQKEAYQQAEGSQEARKFLEKAELHFTIRQLCYRIMDIDRRDEILYRFLRVFSEWQKKAEIQQKAGDINAASSNAIALQAKQYLFEKKQLEADRYSLIQELNGMIMSGNSFTPSMENTVDKNIPALIASFESHPSVQVADALVKEQVAETALEMNRLAPDFSLGYSNLSIAGWQTPDGISQKYYAPSYRFGIVQAGIAIPIFKGAARAKINAAKVKEDIAEMQKQQQLENLNRRLTDVISQFRAAKEAYDYYVSEGLKLSMDSWNQARKRLDLGDISYAEYSLLQSQHLQILIAHAETIHQLQMASATFQFLTEKK